MPVDLTEAERADIQRIARNSTAGIHQRLSRSISSRPVSSAARRLRDNAPMPASSSSPFATAMHGPARGSARASSPRGRRSPRAMPTIGDRPPERGLCCADAEPVTGSSLTLALVRVGKKQQGGFQAETLPAQRLRRRIYTAAPRVAL